MNNISIRKNLRFNSKSKRTIFIIWLIPILMVFISGLLIASTQRQANYADWYNHWITSIIGIAIAYALSRLSLEKIRPLIPSIYILTVISLIAVKLIGVSALGSQRWITLGGFNVQPSEFAKITAILILARILDRQQSFSINNMSRLLIIIAIPWFLVFTQPDLGTSLVFGSITLTMLYWSDMPFEWILLVLSAIFTALMSGLFPITLLIWIPFTGYLAYRSLPGKYLPASLVMASQSLIAVLTPWLWKNALQDYQRERLVLFLDPSKDPLGGGYHLLQSKVGIGSGGLWGTGLLQGELTKLRFIPEQHTDFIFSALGEEMGFLGTMFVITGFFLLLLILFQVAKGARTDFESLIVIGIASMLMFQVVVNIFMTIGLGPVTGIPLPFMSYGRTALLVNFASIGLCISVARRGYLASRDW